MSTHQLFRWSKFSSLVAFCVISFQWANAQELPDPLRYEKSVLAFEEADKLAMPPENAIVLLGSSSIMYWNENAPKDLAPLTVIPRGFGGTVMNDALHYLDRLALKYKPRAILLYEGDNDTGKDKIPNEQIISQLEQIIAKTHEALPQARIYLLSVKPSVSRAATWPVAQALNAQYADLAANDSLITYINVAQPFLKEDGSVMTDIFVDDNLHLNEKGYSIWAATIREVLMEHEAKFE